MRPLDNKEIARCLLPLSIIPDFQIFKGKFSRLATADIVLDLKLGSPPLESTTLCIRTTSSFVILFAVEFLAFMVIFIEVIQLKNKFGKNVYEY